MLLRLPAHSAPNMPSPHFLFSSNNLTPSLSDYEVSKKVTFLLRHSQHVRREEDGAVHSGESRKIFRNISCIALIGLTTSGRRLWQEEEDTRKDFNIYLRALQVH